MPDPALRDLVLERVDKDMKPRIAFLKSITVEGFRGIGQKATLDVAPGPGLTLIVGRNGSGKSPSRWPRSG